LLDLLRKSRSGSRRRGTALHLCRRVPPPAVPCHPGGRRPFARQHRAAAARWPARSLV